MVLQLNTTLQHRIAAEDLLRADTQSRERKLEIVGAWHTHPDHPARPSATDRVQAWDGWSYLILSVGARRSGSTHPVLPCTAARQLHG